MPSYGRHFVIGLAWAWACGSAWPQSAPAHAAPAAAAASAGAAKKAPAAARAAALHGTPPAHSSPRPARRAASAAAQAPDWHVQLAACKQEAGMNLIKRERCVYANCKGHWGEGDCPPGQDLPNKDSFKNPFKKSSP